MNIDYIDDIIKVAETKSINKASQSLNISTPALSKRIKHVEDYFNCALFYRTSQGMFLTSTGEIVLKKLLEVKQKLDELKMETNSINASKIRMGLLPSFSLYKLEHTKDKIIEDTVDIKIENNTQVLLKHLSNGNIDIITGDISSTNNKKLFYKTLYSEEYMIVFHKSNTAIDKKSLFIEDLLEYKIFLLNPPCDTLAFIKNNFSNLKLDIECKENLEAILASVKTKQGITIIPKSLAKNIEGMNLSLTPLANYSRKIGLISYNLETINNIFKILPVDVKNLS
jgi:DNA-binding transcriptional LysR family regulator